MIERRTLLAGVVASALARTFMPAPARAGAVHPHADLQEMWSIAKAHVPPYEISRTRNPVAATALRHALERRFGSFPIVFRGTVVLDDVPRLVEVQALGVRDPLVYTTHAVRVRAWRDGKLFVAGDR